MYTKLTTQFIEQFINALYPVRTGIQEDEWTVADLKEDLILVLESNYFPTPNSEEIAALFLEKVFQLKTRLDLDVQAIYEGDPAAKSKIEIILTYPGFFAIAAYRIAHELHVLGIELIPRIITEYAHRLTGIDIHPAAIIGNSICIDHGTGIVIGETAIIGDHVKIYQGVTLGALSTKSSERNDKRHPTVENNVILYAQATILGGETTIGEGSIIGGNTWITESVPPFSKVTYQQQQTKQNYQLNIV